MQQNEAAGMRAAAAASELQLQAAGEAEQHEEQSRRLRDSCAFTLRSHASLVCFLSGMVSLCFCDFLA